MPRTSVPQYRFTHLGMDVHRDSISVAVLPRDGETAEVDKIFNDADSVRRLIARLESLLAMTQPASARYVVAAAPVRRARAWLWRAFRLDAFAADGDIISPWPGGYVRIAITDRESGSSIFQVEAEARRSLLEGIASFRDRPDGSVIVVGARPRLRNVYEEPRPRHVTASAECDGV